LPATNMVALEVPPDFVDNNPGDATVGARGGPPGYARDPGVGVGFPHVVGSVWDATRARRATRMMAQVDVSTTWRDVIPATNVMGTNTIPEVRADRETQTETKGDKGIQTDELTAAAAAQPKKGQPADMVGFMGK
jgi:hypothetical protein